VERDPDIDLALRELWRMAKGRPRMRQQIRRAIGVPRLTYLGLELELHPADNHTEFFLWLRNRAPEHAAALHYRELFAGRDVTIVDVGANAGIFTLPIAAAAGPASRFVLFEPNPRMLARLERNLSLNDIPGVEVAAVAVGDRAGEAELSVPPQGNLGAARIDLPFEGGTTIRVPLVRLDEELARRGVGRADLLKVDIEGLEDRAILPLLETLPPGMLPRQIYFEDAHGEHWSRDLLGALAQAGYVATERFGKNAVYECG
jgi:FkbM family methyltransferase